MYSLLANVMRLPTRKAEKERELLAKDDNYLTPEAIARMSQELVDLEKRQRPEAADEVFRTGQMGDLSENAAYQFAKQNLRRINSRILSITEKLKHAVPIARGSSDGKIRIGSTVVVEAGGRQFTFEILGSNETNPARGRISHNSPLGQALLGHKVNDDVALTLPQGEARYRVIEVK